MLNSTIFIEKNDFIDLIFFWILDNIFTNDNFIFS